MRNNCSSPCKPSNARPHCNSSIMKQPIQLRRRSSRVTASRWFRVARCYGAIIGGTLAIVVPLAGQTPRNAPGRHTVVIRQMHFDPSQISVPVGDVVEWKNEDIFAHTVTASDGSFDSGLIDPGKSWQVTVERAGTIAYHCRPHPNMTAEIIVGHSAESTENKSQANASLRWHPPHKPSEIHPILVNFTAALLPLAFLCDVLGLAFRRQSLHHAAFWMVLFDACITPLTAAAGWWWKSAVAAELPARLITVHEWLGTTAAVIFIALASWRWRIHQRDEAPSTAYMAFAFVAVIALIYQGSLGGMMVFGR